MQLIEANPPQNAVVEKAEGRGGELFSSYFELSFVFPKVILSHPEELSDMEVLEGASQAGTFAFLDAPEEDVYNDHPALRQQSR